MSTAVATSAAAAAAAMIRFAARDDEIAFQFERLNCWADDARRLRRRLLMLLMLLLLLLLMLLSGVMVGRQFGGGRCRRHSRRVMVMTQRLGQRHVERRRWFTATARTIGSVVATVEARAKRSHRSCEWVR